jgi:hypothetical protein
MPMTQVKKLYKKGGKMKDGGKVKGYRAGGMTRGCGAATKGRNHSNKMG